MKHYLAPAILVTAIVIFSSCTKNNSTPSTPTVTHDTVVIITHDTVAKDPLNPIVGLWVGTLTANNEPAAGKLYYSFDIRSDSTILTQSEGADGNTYYNQGTWTLSGTTFKATTTSTTAGNAGVVQTLTATYSSNGTLSSGVWGNQAGTAQGTFSLSRIN
jgi:hypothetical protein